MTQNDNQNRQEKPATSYDKIKEWLDTPAMVKVLEKTLPKVVPVEPWIQSALTTVRMDKELLKCEPMSIMGALMTAASMGLRLEGAMGQAYFSARAVREYDRQTRDWVTLRHEAQLQIGYRGFIDLAYRDKDVREVESVIVYENDSIDFGKGSQPFINHTWDARMSTQDRGRMVSVYPGLRYKDGFYSFELYPMSDVIEHRNKILLDKGIQCGEDDDGREVFYKTDRNGNDYQLQQSAILRIPWLGYPIPMIKKTGIRWAAKYWPLSPDFQRAVELSGLDDADVSQRLGEFAADILPDKVRDDIKRGSDTPNRIIAPANNLSISRRNELTEQMAAEAAKREVAERGQESEGSTTQKHTDDNENDDAKTAIDVEKTVVDDDTTEAELRKAQEKIENDKKRTDKSKKSK